jgi:hypothetical protein
LRGECERDWCISNWRGWAGGKRKTALVHVLSQALWPKVNLAVVTNDIYTREDAEFLIRQGTLAADAFWASKPAGVRIPRFARMLP